MTVGHVTPMRFSGNRRLLVIAGQCCGADGRHGLRIGAAL